jgi:flavin reductase (DIM6/NTAB) family NADH-FMN oxidoreductase RutF
MSTTTQTQTPADQLRRAIGRFATGVTVVTTQDQDGAPVGTTATAVSSLSLEPPLLLVCLTNASSTLRAILTRRIFSVNILAEHQHELSSNFARSGEHASWDAVSYGSWPSGSPRIDGSVAGLECALSHVLDGGDHRIVLGRVLHAEAEDDSIRPLIHWRGRYEILGRP